MIISESCFLTSSFCHPSFHQQKPITAGQRFDNKASSAFFAQRETSTRGLCSSQPNSATMIGFPGLSLVRRGYASFILNEKLSVPSRICGVVGPYALSATQSQ